MLERSFVIIMKSKENRKTISPSLFRYMYFPVLLSIVKPFNMFNESLMNEHTLIILTSELEKLNLDPRSLRYRRVQNICRGKIIIMALVLQKVPSEGS